MKASKKTMLSIASMTKDRGSNVSTVKPAAHIKLRTVTNAERQQMRISSYQYLLP